MIVCVCHRVSESDIQREARQGCSSFDELQDELRVATACGRCSDCARSVFDEALRSRPIRSERSGSPAPRIIPIFPTLPGHQGPLAA